LLQRLQQQQQGPPPQQRPPTLHYEISSRGHVDLNYSHLPQRQQLQQLQQLALPLPFAPQLALPLFSQPSQLSSPPSWPPFQWQRHLPSNNS
jgi:hypothetical protein